MKALIMVFSPGGNTLKTAKMLEDELDKRMVEAQILDLTGKGQLFKDRNFREYLDNAVALHDLLCVGGPVYAHHMHYNVLDIIRNLPEPGGKWGKFSIPFVTYGTISSGVSLYETAVMLQKTGRINICGMKIEAFHNMSRILKTKAGDGLPGPGSIPVISNLADRIGSLQGMEESCIKDATGSLNFQSISSVIKAKTVFREKFWQKHIYPGLKMDPSSCSLCGKCVKACPVQRLKLEEGVLDIGGKPDCIHCGECVNSCSNGVLRFNCDPEKWDKLFAKAAAGRGPMPSHEQPKSAVYPQGKGLMHS